MAQEKHGLTMNSPAVLIGRRPFPEAAVIPILQALPPIPEASLLPAETLSRGYPMRIGRGSPVPESPGLVVHSLYYVREGLLRTFRSSPSGGRKTLHLVGRGYFIFESYFLNRRPLQIDCDVLRDCILVRFDTVTAGRLIQHDAFFSQRLLCSIALKMQLMGDDLVSIAYDRPTTRLRLCLASLVDMEQNDSLVHISQMQLAELLGVHRVSIGRMLLQMQKNGEVELGRGRILLRPPFFASEELRQWSALLSLPNNYFPGS